MESNNNGVCGSVIDMDSLGNIDEPVHATVHKTGNIDAEIEHLNETGRENDHNTDQTDLDNCVHAGAIYNNVDNLYQRWAKYGQSSGMNRFM